MMWCEIVVEGGVQEYCGIMYLYGEGKAQNWAENEKNQDSKSPKNKDNLQSDSREDKEWSLWQILNLLEGLHVA